MQDKTVSYAVCNFSVMTLVIILLMVFNSATMAATDLENSDPAIQALIDNLAKNEGFKITKEEINLHNLMGKKFVVILPWHHVEGYILRGASGNGDILVYMKKDSIYILAGKLDGNSYEMKEANGKVGLIKRSHASGQWEPPTAYELSGDKFVESDTYQVAQRNNTEWFDVNARVSSLYDLSDEVTMKTILERALEEGKKKSGRYSFMSAHVYQNDKLAVDFGGVGNKNLDTTEKVIASSKIDNMAKRNQEDIILELKKGNVSVVRSMIDSGTRVDAREEGSMEGDKVAGPTLLMLTACGKDCGVPLTPEDQMTLLGFLLSKSADVNAYTPWGATVLTYAIAGGRGQATKTEEETKGGASRLPIVMMLLEHGAKTNVDATYEDKNEGYTCLTRAAMYGFHQVVGLLFQYGAKEGLDQAFKFAKEHNHTQTAKMIQDKFWSNFKSDCMTNSGFTKSVMIGEPVDTENYGIAIVQGKRSNTDRDISTAICIFDKQNEKMEFAEPSAFKKFPFALDALAKSKDKELQREAQKLTCNSAQQLLSSEPILDQGKKFNCILNSKFTKSLIIGEPTDTENHSVFVIQGKRLRSDDNLITSICIYDKKSEKIEFVELSVFTQYPFALNTLIKTIDEQDGSESTKSICKESQQLLVKFYNSTEESSLDVLFKSTRFSNITIELVPENNKIHRHSSWLYANSLQEKITSENDKFFGFLKEKNYLDFNKKIIQIIRKNVPNKTFAKLTQEYHYYTQKISPLINYSPSNIPVLKIATRNLSAINYKNEYIAPPSGILSGSLQGNIKVMALTFTYSIIPTLEDFPKPNKLYKGKAKIYLDPDDGNWKIASLDLNDNGAQEIVNTLPTIFISNYITSEINKYESQQKAIRNKELETAGRFSFEINKSNIVIADLTSDDAILVEPISGSYCQVGVLSNDLRDTMLENKQRYPASVVTDKISGRIGGAGKEWNTNSSFFLDMQDMLGREIVRAERVSIHANYCSDPNFKARVTILCVDNYLDVNEYNLYLKNKHLMSCAARFNLKMQKVNAKSLYEN